MKNDIAILGIRLISAVFSVIVAVLTLPYVLTLILVGVLYFGLWVDINTLQAYIQGEIFPVELGFGLGIAILGLFLSLFLAVVIETILSYNSGKVIKGYDKFGTDWDKIYEKMDATRFGKIVLWIYDHTEWLVVSAILLTCLLFISWRVTGMIIACWLVYQYFVQIASGCEKGAFWLVKRLAPSLTISLRN